MRRLAASNGMSLSQYLRILFSTPAEATDTIGDIRRRFRERLLAEENGK